MSMQALAGIAEVQRQAAVLHLEWMLDQYCTQEQRDAFANVMQAKPDDLAPWALENGYALVLRTVVANRENGVKPEPVRKDDAPVRRTDAELWSALDWAYERKKQKPWFPDNDSPKMMTTCNAYIALVEEVLELRAYKAREHVRH